MPSLIDLIGKTYEKLTVIKRDEDYRKNNNLKNHKTYWLCQCQCGNLTTVDSYRLVHGLTKSCGCLQKEIVSKSNEKDLTGMTFSYLYVLEQDKTRSHKKKESYYYICKCRCGTIKSIRGSSLMDGTIQSCGCYRKEITSKLFHKDLTGQRFGKLQALEYKGESIWKCLCDCGEITFVSASSLLRGNTCSCGCINSKGNLKISQLLTQNNIIFQKEYHFDDLINPKTEYCLRFDFAIFNKSGELSHLIEYDGAQHFYTTPKGYYTQENIDKIHYLDTLKNQYCEIHNIPLIRIPYTKYKQLSIQDLLI